MTLVLRYAARSDVGLIREGNSAGIQYWWGNSSQFDALEQKTVLIHEMAHALMDQHHDLLALQRAATADMEARS